MDVDNPWATTLPHRARGGWCVAAIDAFAEQGYHATTTRDIATRAGLSPAGLYVHYPSKAALLARSVGSATTPRSPWSSPQRPAARPVQRLRRVVARFVAWHAEHHRVAQVVQYQLNALPPQDRAAVVAIRRRIETVVEQVLRDGVAEQAMTVAQPRRVARAILSMGIDVARWYDPAGQDSPADLGALYADLAVRMVGRGAATEGAE